MPKFIGQIVLQANPGQSASPDDWRAVVHAIYNTVRAGIANVKENGYTESIPDRKETTDIQPSAQAVSGKEPTA